MKTKPIICLAFIASSLSCNSAAASGALPRHKFDAWFGTYAHHFEKSSTVVCSSTLRRYRNSGPDASVANFKVAHHADCILANTTETIKANMGSAGVILGLMPSLLSAMGPSLTESSMLVLERPFLSVLLAIGGPALYPLRPYDQHDALQGWKEPFRTPPRIPSSYWARVLVSLLQYLLALAAAVNVVEASLQLGFKTVVTWNKNQSYLPLAWVIFPLGIHLIAMLRLYLFSEKVCPPRSSSLRRSELLMSTSREQVLNRAAARPTEYLSNSSWPKPNSVRRVIDADFHPMTIHFWHTFSTRCYRSCLYYIFLWAPWYSRLFSSSASATPGPSYCVVGCRHWLHS